ncbi:hypothetical protein F5Y12DRAFT_737590 [Xylaria sp. FL1777]|nr:hypothetical protein F5Y12DRAFT_737590 [Xylaria sp. FL1777]
MKAIPAFSRFFPFFDRKPHELSRSQTRFGLMAPTESTASSRSTYLDQPPQVIAASSINGQKLREVLNEKFGSAYRLELRSDYYRLYSDGKLSEQEIAWCRY